MIQKCSRRRSLFWLHTHTASAMGSTPAYAHSGQVGVTASAPQYSSVLPAGMPNIAGSRGAASAASAGGGGTVGMGVGSVQGVGIGMGGVVGRLNSGGGEAGTGHGRGLGLGDDSPLTLSGVDQVLFDQSFDPMLSWPPRQLSSIDGGSGGGGGAADWGRAAWVSPVWQERWGMV